jgi:formate dehydrogenase major subunit
MPQWDLANADCVLVMGSNMAENHPIAFRFVLQAKDRGATVIHADPRFTRTSALADIHAPLRAGSDIAFLGGLIRHILEHDLWFREWVLPFTNLSTVIDARFRDASDAEGLFSGWDAEHRKYGYDTWQYEGVKVPSSLAEHHVNTAESFAEKTKRIGEAAPHRDETLRHPFCVYQILKRHFAAYTPQKVEEITGCPAETLVRVAETLARNSGRERTSSICYAVGWTHHTVGVQIIRAAAILQGLLGNVGRPGGGILALRGHCSIQGSTDIPTLYNLLPGYLPHPQAFKTHSSLEEYLESERTPTGWWHHFPEYAVSMLRAWYGDHGNEGNGWGFGWIPKNVGDHSQLPMTLAMREGLIRGMFILGQNPAVGGSNANQVVQQGLARLDWLVVRDFTESDTASFWHAGQAVREGTLRPQDIATEVFLMPASLASGEKEGTFTNTHRLLQWHDKVVDAPGDNRSELWFVYHLGKRLQAMYADSDAQRDAPIRNLTWDYPVSGERADPSAEAVLKEINGYTVADGKPVKTYKDLKSDGSTAAGAWIYTGVYPEEGVNKARGRKADGPDGPGTHLGWGFAWPSNRRTMYNRASADPEGKPWSERKKLVWWNAQEAKWESPDEIDFEATKPPGYRPDWDSKPQGMDAIAGTEPFIMIADGRCSLFVPSGLKDAPLPTHYEPVDSPLRNPLYAQQDNPVAKKWPRDFNAYHAPGDPQYPHVLTTYRLTEHHSGGTPTRAVAATAELQPEGFAEIPEELAAELGIATRDWVVLSTARGEVETRALVTARLQPLQLDGRRIYQIGMPFHYGWQGYATGAPANILTSVVGDPNVSIHEGKAFTCGLRKGRLHPEDPP